MLTEKQQERFADLIQDRYSLEGLANYLDLGVEMLHYIEEDSFERCAIQGVVTALRDIVVILRQGP